MQVMTAAQLEHARLVEQVLREMEVEAAIAQSPAKLKQGKALTEHNPGQIHRYRCGGGYRVVKKRIGSN